MDRVRAAAEVAACEAETPFDQACGMAGGVIGLVGGYLAAAAAATGVAATGHLGVAHAVGAHAPAAAGAGAAGGLIGGVRVGKWLRALLE
jgi:hypothetical protein